MESWSLNLSDTSVLVVIGVVIAYVSVITLFGGYFARFNKNINDFFYSGQRFSWWLPAASMVATGIGSYSFLKYSEQGYNTGMSSTMSYTNDWFVLPFFLFGWLPIIYYARIKSIPEYFHRRFNSTARYLSLVILLAYMLFYIGYNLFSIGVATEGLFGIPQIWSMPILAAFLGFYVTYGGQTAVVFTDLFQGFMLYIAGFIALFAGVYALGGLDQFWGWLPTTHRLPFVHLTENYKFNTVGLFWGEALAGSVAFAFMNQGFIMRYLTIKSVDDGRKAAVFNILVTMPTSALIVGGVGWIGKSLVERQFGMGPIPGYMPIDIANTFHTFLVVCWSTLKQNPWVFGFVIASLMAALMSTIDTLINACAAVLIYDIYKPLISPKANDKQLLYAARWASMISTFVGLLLVIWFNKQKGGSLMEIHYKGIMVIIPAMVTVLFLGVFWKRFNSYGACAAMIFGSMLAVATVWFPGWIEPLSEFVSGPINGKYIYMRALFGICASAVIGITVSLLTPAQDENHHSGLTVWSITDAMRAYKGGGEPNFKKGEKLRGITAVYDNNLPEGVICVSKNTKAKLGADIGDIIYVSDQREILGGLRSDHLKITTLVNQNLKDDEVLIHKTTFKEAYLLEGRPLSLEKMI